MRVSRGVALITAGALSAAGLVACAPARPSLEQIRSAVGEAVEAVPGIDGALVSASTAGLSGSGVTVIIYVPDSARLSESVDGALEATWFASPIDPYSVSITAFAGEMPDGVDFGHATGEYLDLVQVADDLGIDDSEVGTGVDASGVLLTVRDYRLSERYGPREHTDE